MLAILVSVATITLSNSVSWGAVVVLGVLELIYWVTVSNSFEKGVDVAA